MHRGYIKLWRKCTDSKMYQNPKLWTLWTYLLLEATHKPIKRYIGNQVVEQMPGQYITGRKRLAKELRVSERSIRTPLLALVKDQKVTIKTTNKYSIISIVNWDTYQPEKDKTTSKTTNDRPATDQQPTTEQEHKNVKNTNKSRKIEFPKGFSLTEDLRKYAVNHEIDSSKVELFFESFENWAKAKNIKYIDWKRAFQNFVLKAPDYGKQFLKSEGRAW